MNDQHSYRRDLHPDGAELYHKCKTCPPQQARLQIASCTQSRKQEIIAQSQKQGVNSFNTMPGGLDAVIPAASQDCQQCATGILMRIKTQGKYDKSRI